MTGSAQQDFDAEFRAIRRFVLRGKLTVTQASEQLKKYGRVAENKMVQERRKEVKERSGLRAGREEEFWSAREKEEEAEEDTSDE